jgi:hypothetical protein
MMESIFARYEKREPDDGMFHATFYATKLPGCCEEYRVDNAAQALPWFQQYFGRFLGEKFSWYAAHSVWQTEAGRQQLAAAIDNPATVEAAPAPVAIATPAVKQVKCRCGHTVPQTLVMSASLGSSCPDCYDRMSN